MTEHEAVIRHDPDAHRFELVENGEVVGFTQYRVRTPQLWEFFHTEIDPAHEGKGLAGRLIGSTLDQLRADGVEIAPVCPYIRAYLARHPEWVDLVPVGARAEYGLA